MSSCRLIDALVIDQAVRQAAHDGGLEPHDSMASAGIDPSAVKREAALCWASATETLLNHAEAVTSAYTLGFELGVRAARIADRAELETEAGR